MKAFKIVSVVEVQNINILARQNARDWRDHDVSFPPYTVDVSRGVRSRPERSLSRERLAA
jgi:hypothetical protein